MKMKMGTGISDRLFSVADFGIKPMTNYVLVIKNKRSNSNLMTKTLIIIFFTELLLVHNCLPEFTVCFSLSAFVPK